MLHAAKLLWKTAETFQVSVLVILQPNLQKKKKKKKKKTKHFYDIICLQQMLCNYKA